MEVRQTTVAARVVFVDDACALFSFLERCMLCMRDTQVVKVSSLVFVAIEFSSLISESSVIDKTVLHNDPSTWSQCV